MQIKQESILEGCVPTVAVAFTLGGVPYPTPDTLPLDTIPPSPIPYPWIPYPLDTLPLRKDMGPEIPYPSREQTSAYPCGR